MFISSKFTNKHEINNIEITHTESKPKQKRRRKTKKAKSPLSPRAQMICLYSDVMDVAKEKIK